MAIRLRRPLIFLGALLALVFAIDQWRHFYCAGATCITLWKRLGGKCYVVNGKHYGVIVPSERSYVRTTNDELLGFYLHRSMPQDIIVADKEDNESEVKHFSIVNKETDSKHFLAYNKREYGPLLFTSTDPIKPAIAADTTVILVDILPAEAYVTFGSRP